ncbi:MAG: DUF1269 domain-containing protein, partial [Firmicutes bacterium]|nr:DUF1269 domain-containing protein [Bacillota bacterium]
MQNIIAAVFKNEREGFQAIAELKKQPVNEKAVILQMALVKRDEKGFEICDRYDNGLLTSSETIIGGLMGGVLGILGGPIGVLLMGSYGALLGSVADTTDVIGGEVLLEMVANKLADGDTALIMLTEEDDEAVFDEELKKFNCEIARFDAAAVAEEVEEAARLEVEMARQARYDLRKTILDDHKTAVEEKRSKLMEELQQ